MLRGKEWTRETAEGGQESAGKATEASWEERETSRTLEAGCSEGRTRIGGQKRSGRGESGTERNKYAGRSRERCKEGSQGMVRTKCVGS